MRSFFTFLWVLVLITACCGSKKLASDQQGISGTVNEVRGNRMPGPGVQLPPPSPLQTTVYIFEPATASEAENPDRGPLYTQIRTRLVDSVRTNEEGKFRLSLPSGKYSVFVAVDGKYFANQFDQNNIIHPVTVEKGKFTEVNITVNDKAYF